MAKSESVSTTVRIPKDIFEKIEFEASTQDSPIATIINNVLRKYVTWDRFINDIGFMYIQKPLLRGLFENQSEKDVVKIASTTGHARMRDAVLFMSGKIDSQGIIDVIKLWLSTSNIPIRVSKDEQILKFIVQHNLGKKWSVYFATVLKSLFVEINVKVKKEDLKDHTALLDFTISKNKKIKNK